MNKEKEKEKIPVMQTDVEVTVEDSSEFLNL